MLPAKNLTSTFLRLRSEHLKKKNRFGTSILSSLQEKNDKAPREAGDIEIGVFQENLELPPQWTDSVTESKDLLERVKEKMSTLQKLQQRRLLHVFDSKGLEKPEMKIENTTREIADLLKRTEIRLVELQPRAGISEWENTARAGAQTKIASEIQAITQEFRKQQNLYMNEIRTRQGSIEDTWEADTGDGSSQRMMQQSQSSQLQDNWDPKSRNQEISKISYSMLELRDMFKQLSNLVVDQGTLLDRIDFNVEKVAHETKAANVHLRKAEQYQNSGRARCIILSLLGGIVFMVMILVVKHL